MHLISWLIKEYALILTRSREGHTQTTPPTIWKQGTKGDIIWLQGYSETWIYGKVIGDYLNTEGYRIHVVSQLEKNRLTIPAAAEAVEKYVTENDLHTVTFIAHSKGGIIGKYFLSNSQYASRVKKLICITTPFAGTYLAYIVARHNGLEFVPQSQVIKTLAKDTESNKKIVNIYGTLDNHVIPNKNLYLEGAQNIQLPIWGHTIILESALLLKTLSKVLQEA